MEEEGRREGAERLTEGEKKNRKEGTGEDFEGMREEKGRKGKGELNETKGEKEDRKKGKVEAFEE